MPATTGSDHQPADPTTVDPLPAEVWQRVAARLVDHVGLAVITAVLLAPLGLLGSWLGGPAEFLADSLAVLLSTALTVGYFAALEARDGQTVGKRLLGMRVVTPSGESPTIGAALRRNAWTGLGVLSVVPVVGGVVGGAATLAAAVTIVIGITRDPQRRGWHDRLAAGTRVVSAR